MRIADRSKGPHGSLPVGLGLRDKLKSFLIFFERLPVLAVFEIVLADVAVLRYLLV